MGMTWVICGSLQRREYDDIAALSRAGSFHRRTRRRRMTGMRQAVTERAFAHAATLPFAPARSYA
jgi:hypothetical protein